MTLFSIPAAISTTVPKRPINTPRICLPFNASPKRTIPTKVVNNGETEFKIDVIPLLISVWAKAKKNGGKKELHRPAITTHFQSAFARVFNDLKPNKKSESEANKIRKPPTCKGVKPNNDFLIRIKDEPHINARIIR